MNKELTMHRNTFIVISILAMILLTGSLMAFQQSINVTTNYDGYAYIEISEIGKDGERIPSEGDFNITTSSNNTQTSSNGLDEETAYTATVYAHRYQGGVIITDSDSQNFTYATGPITLNVDLSGLVPDDPPIQD
jgi:hypothetical protein